MDSLSRRWPLPIAFAVLLSVAACAADLPAQDVIFAVPAEQYGFASGVIAATADGAHGGIALRLSDTGSVAGALDLQPGQYTLLVRVFAPAGDQDGFFVEIGKERTRRVAPIGRWGVLAYPVVVDAARQVPLSVIGQAACSSATAPPTRTCPTCRWTAG